MKKHVSKKIIFFICILFFISFIMIILSGCESNSKIEYPHYNSNNSDEDNNDNNNFSLKNNNSNSNNIQNNEEKLSKFSTKIYTPNDKGRQHNIKLTCSKLNGTIIKSGETFSFCDTVGKATPEKGYKKADVFDSNGNIIKGYGGRKLPDK